MKIITFSDLHLEFGIDFRSPEDSSADVMVLAGDIITFRDYDPLSRFLEGWHKPVIFVAGIHEFYTNTTMYDEVEKFQQWIATAYPNVHFLQNQSITIDGIHFFGGTDMIGAIDQYQPDLWIYGHTHECDDHYREKTRIISNQRGYQHHGSQYECENMFDPAGKPIDLNE